MSLFTMRAIGQVHGGRTIPEDDHWGESQASIILDHDDFTPESLAGLDRFSHAETIFVFDRVGETEITYDARHPRGNKDWPKVGIFAQRGKNWPNRIGVTICRITGITGTTLHVTDLNAINGTPVLDIKPMITAFMPRGEMHEPDWARELMQSYW